MHVDEGAILAFGALGAFGQDFGGLGVGIGVGQAEAGARGGEALEMLVELEDPALPRGGDVIDHVGVQETGIENRNLGVFELDELAIDVNATCRHFLSP